MKAHFAGIWKLVAILGLIAAAGCSVVPEPQADLTRYYILAEPVVDLAAKPSADGLKVGLFNVQMPPYLDKGVIVVRAGENELVYNDYARWAEPLADSLTRVLRERLLASPRVARVFTEGFPFDQKRDCDVMIRIQRCEGVESGGRFLTRFVATIEITKPEANGGMIFRKVFAAPESAWDGRDYGALVVLLSQAASGLGDEIAAAL